MEVTVLISRNTGEKYLLAVFTTKRIITTTLMKRRNITIPLINTSIEQVMVVWVWGLVECAGCKLTEDFEAKFCNVRVITFIT